MEDQQSTAESRPSQALTPPDGKSTEDMQQVNPDGSDTTATVQISPSKPPRKRNALVESLKLGLWKLWILVWKNFLFRRRAWVSLIVLYFQALTCTLLSILLGGIGGSTHTELTPQDFLSMEDKFWQEFGGKTVLYATKDPAQATAAREILDMIATSPTIYWVPVADEEQVEREFSEMVAHQRSEFAGAIVFEELKDTEVRYKIRLPDSGASFLKTNDIISPEEIAERRLTYADHNSYYAKGFLGLQILLDRNAAKWLNAELTPNEIQLQSFPYPTHKYDEVGISYAAFCTSFLFSIMLSSYFLAKTVTSEKETGVKELMKLCGYPGWMQLLAWYLVQFLFDCIPIIFIAVMLKFVPGIPGIHNREALRNSDISLFLVMLFLAEIANNAFVFFICSFIKSATVATTATLLITVIGAIIIMLYFLIAKPDALPALMGLSVLPHACLYVAASFYFSFEILDQGAHWSLLGASRPSSSSKMCLGYALLMFIVDIVLYQSLAVYVENIVPSDYGIRKPWYYPAQAIINPIKGLINKKRKMGNGGDSKSQNDQLLTESESRARGFEPYQGSPNNTVGVDVQNLVKKFDGTKVAVGGVSVKMYDGEIFALLGHNGAGKTTLISMLTGMYAPTSGTAKVGGFDITTDMPKVRKSLGLCPQHDMLFTNLTVMEHLKIFGQMKGQSSKKVKEEANSLLNMMKFSEKANTVAKKLSGGQKRKLCLAMALIGEAKVVVLDEPTSGMDPEARRSIWDILLQMRGQRTILLTTHYMEEADVLGDRIGIMAEGKLQCCGSPTYLKSFYGTGYTLKLSLLPEADKTAILPIVQKHIPDASLKPIDMPSEIFISLPSETATSSALSSLFSTLTEKKEAMRIESLGLSVATMDEVFVKVGELSDRAAVEADTAAKPLRSNATVSTKDPQPSEMLRADDITAEKGEVPITEPSQGVVYPSEAPSKPIPVKSRRLTCNLKLLLTQTFALFMKRFIYAKRKFGFSLFLILFPTIMAICVVLLVNNGLSPGSPYPPLKIAFDSYKNPVTLFSSEDPAQKDTIQGVIGSSAKYTGNVQAGLEAAGKADYPTLRDFYIVAGDLRTTEYVAWFNLMLTHSAPLAINLASNVRGALLPKKMTFTVINHPLQTKQALVMEAATNVPSIGPALFPLIFVIFALPLLWVIFPTEERLNQSKQLQLMTGVHPLIYWGVLFTWDFLAFLLIAIVMIAIFGIFGNYAVFTTNGGLGVLFIIILSFGYNLIPLAYLISNIPKSVAGAVFTFIAFQILPIIPTLILKIFSAEAANWFSRLFPLLSSYECGKQFAEMASLNVKCNYLGEAERKLICDNQGSGTFIELRACCPCGTFPGVTCYKPPPYIQWEKDAKPQLISLTRGPDKEPAIGQLLLILFIMSIITQALHVLIELGVFRFIRSKMIKSNDWDFKDEVYDEDVREEKQRVADVIMTGTTDTEALVVDDLCKNYGDFSAVSKLTFGVHHGECFGLLGTNGAGKTTTFRIITGDEIQSIGNAFQGRLSLKKNRRALISHIGYCPQFDAFIPYLTGKENLQLFARLRGVPWKQVNKEADKWLEKVGLTESGKVKCKKYSGGMKRRLSAAIALIGDPVLVLLDEPTSGVDPVSRRQFWKVLESVKASGKSIILTSHSMDECETLCARLGIMVNGQLQCIGGVQHLKHKYAQGYSLNLRLKSQFQGVGPPQPEQFQSQQVPQQQFQQQPQQQFQQQPQQQFQFQNVPPQQFQQPQQFSQPQYSRILQNPYQQQQSQPSQQQQPIFQQQQQLFKYEETFHQAGQELNPNSDEGLRRLHAEITEKFHPCFLRDQHETVLQYQIENAALGWDVIYKTLEDLKKSHGDIIEDYSVSETSLEEVFLSFSRKQYPPRNAKIPLCKRIVTCQF